MMCESVCVFFSVIFTFIGSLDSLARFMLPAAHPVSHQTELFTSKTARVSVYLGSLETGTEQPTTGLEPTTDQRATSSD